ncbi:MAG: hypothetical protein HW386_1718 [Gammaproteobacteria bacterium]|nr:hypothetical protein [Gammaproteobacteria bacterium]
MNRSDLRIAKWLLSIEALVSFAPMTLLWLVRVIQLRRFLGEPGIVLATAYATIAPLALLLALRYIVFGRPPNFRGQIALVAGFGLIGMLQIIAIYTAPGPNFSWYQGEWVFVLLCSILPALCCLHLSQLAESPPRPTGANLTG